MTRFIFLACTILFTADLALGAERRVAVIFAVGDIATCSTDPIRSGKATADRISQEIQAIRRDDAKVEIRVLALGDLAYNSGSEQSFGCFQAAWGQFNDILLPVPGNHDYETANGANYFKHFRKRLSDLRADPGLGFYSLRLPTTDDASWLLIGLNTNTETGANGRQIAWLKSLLKDNATTRCVVAFGHAFYYSSGLHGHDDGTGRAQNSRPDLSKPLLPSKTIRAAFEALHAGQASLFLAGHDHHFEQLGRAAPNANPSDRGASAARADGVRSFVVGTGGKNLYGYDYAQKWAFTEAYDLKSYGALKIELFEGSYSWSYLQVPSQQPSSMQIVKSVNRDTCAR